MLSFRGLRMAMTMRKVHLRGLNREMEENIKTTSTATKGKKRS